MVGDPNPASIEVLHPSTVPEESGVEKNLRAPDQAEGPYRTDCPQVNPGWAPQILLSKLDTWSPVQNRNVEMEF